MTHRSPRDLLSEIVADLRDEGSELHRLLHDMDIGYWTQPTTFKSWTAWDVVAHLHTADQMAMLSLTDSEAFHQFMQQMRAATSMRAFTAAWLNEGREQALTGASLLDRWWHGFEQLCKAFDDADPERRYVWAGPDMKARMLATARLMETWAHGWDIYDLLGIERSHTDRIRHVAEIGVRTYGWTFTNRKQQVPEPVPYVRLTAPSGAIWEWGDPHCAHRVSGAAVEFCQVVTQVRNIADTALKVSGDNARAWMSIAQCFAGPPETPPAPGSRAPLAH